MPLNMAKPGLKSSGVVKKALKNRLLRMWEVGNLARGEGFVVTVFVVGTVRVVSGGTYVLTDADFDVVVCRHRIPNGELLVDLRVNIEPQVLVAMAEFFRVPMPCLSHSSISHSK